MSENSNRRGFHSALSKKRQSQASVIDALGEQSTAAYGQPIAPF
jgi:hypothetical protein